MFFVYAVIALHVFLKEIYFSENKLLYSHCFSCFCESTLDKISLSNEHLSCVIVGDTVHHGQEAAMQTTRVAGYLGTCSSKAGTEE